MKIMGLLVYIDKYILNKTYERTFISSLLENAKKELEKDRILSNNLAFSAM